MSHFSTNTEHTFKTKNPSAYLQDGLGQFRPADPGKQMRIFSIKEVVRPNGPVSRSKLYADAAAGLVTLRKIGGKTVVNEADFRAYLAGKPLIHRAKAA